MMCRSIPWTVFSLLSVVLLAPFGSRLAMSEGKPASNALELRGDSVVTAGGEFTVSLYLTDSLRIVGGFNFYIEYDYGALVLDSAVLGSHVAKQWEYFTSRSGRIEDSDTGSAKGFVRLVAIADSHDSANAHPNPASLKGPGEFVKLHFYASEHKKYAGQLTTLRFLWSKCSDNSFSDPSGNKLMVASTVVDHLGNAETLPEYSGPDSTCFRSRHNTPTREFELRNHAFRIK